MADSKAFLSMEGLVDNLSKAVIHLKEGKLDVDALEEITNNARELYERLVVLRFEAYESIHHSESDEKPFSYRIETKERSLENQTSLIDAIEEANKESNPKANPSTGTTAVQTPEIGFEESLSESTALEEAPKSEIEAGTTKEQKATESKEVVNKDDLEEKSLAAKLQKSPIDDLKKAISLNQKFQFISAFFGGNSKQYDSFISAVNEANDLSKAHQLIEEALGKLDMEDQVVGMFMELVERRFQ